MLNTILHTHLSELFNEVEVVNYENMKQHVPDELICSARHSII